MKAAQEKKKNPNESLELTVNEYERILFSNLEKLQSLDAVSTGGQELADLIPLVNRENDSLNLFLKHLVSTKINHGKGKKEVLRLINLVCKHHQKDIFPNLTRCMKLICKYLEDNDLSLREACANCVGTLATEVVPPKSDSQDKHFELIWKPLSESLGKLNRITQQGAGACVIEMIKQFPKGETKNQYVLGHLPALLNRFKELLFGKACFCAPQIMIAIGVLVQVTGPGALPSIRTIASYLAEGLAGKISTADWTTRRAAAESFSLIAQTLRDQVGPFKTEIIEVLSKARYDKIKPVRDSVAEALKTYQLWVKAEQENTPPDSKTVKPLLKSTQTASKPSTSATQQKKPASRLSSLPQAPSTEQAKKKSVARSGWTKNPKFFEIRQTYQEGNSFTDDTKTSETAEPKKASLPDQKKVQTQPDQKKVQIAASQSPVQNIIPKHLSNSTPKPEAFTFAPHFEPSDDEVDEEPEALPAHFRNVSTQPEEKPSQMRSPNTSTIISKNGQRPYITIYDESTLTQDLTLEDLEVPQKPKKQIQQKQKPNTSNPQLKESVDLKESMAESTPLKESVDLGESNPLKKSVDLRESTQSMAESTPLKESVDLGESNPLKKSVDLGESNPLKESSPLKDSLDLDEDFVNQLMSQSAANTSQQPDEDEDVDLDQIDDIEFDTVEFDEDEEQPDVDIEQKLKHLEFLSHQIRQENSLEDSQLSVQHEQRLSNLETIITQQNKDFSALFQQQQKMFTMFEQFTLKTSSFMETLENRISKIEKVVEEKQTN